MITHETTEEAMRKALKAIEKDGKVSERPQMIVSRSLKATELEPREVVHHGEG